MYRGRPQQSGPVGGGGGYPNNPPPTAHAQGPMNGHYSSTGSLSGHGGYSAAHMANMQDGPHHGSRSSPSDAAPHFDVRYSTSSSSLNVNAPPNVSAHISASNSPGPASPKSLSAVGDGSLDFDAIRQDCLQKRTLYEDPYFPATDKSLYYSRFPPYRFEWLRPSVSI